MIPAGYMLKKVTVKPAWLESDAVVDVYSLSNCVSGDFADYIKYWEHNGYWLFDSPKIMTSLAEKEGIDLSGTTLFYYEVYEYEFDDRTIEWLGFTPDKFESFETDVQVPIKKYLQGFDVVTFYANTSPEHSPLSCNSLATEISVNQHCLFNAFEETKDAIEQGLFKNSEHGPYRIFAVYTLG